MSNLVDYRKVKKVQCLRRHWHDSKMEATYCNRLYSMERRGEIAGYEIQKCMPLIVNGVKICDHIVDFWVGTEEGLFVEVHEVKGFATPVWKLKKKLFEACYPEIKYVVISQGGPSWTARVKSQERKAIFRRLRSKKLLKNV